jgi:hypothetical protein
MPEDPISHLTTSSSISLSSSLLAHLKHAIAQRIQQLNNNMVILYPQKFGILEEKELRTLECLSDFLRGAEACKIYTMTNNDVNSDYRIHQRVHHQNFDYSKLAWIPKINLLESPDD